MTTIRILPEILSNQIAAGEVVERPSSVVKELVENSIDAGATHIVIEIVNGGKSLIRVSDNGIGLERDDALLAIERYATSKIYDKQDLFAISTMGFRGEALPSIASVSKFSLTTRTRKTDVATRIDMAGGKMMNVSDAGSPVGTMVEVKHLFFNTPARKKFLKSDQTETGHILDTIAGMAMGQSHTQFKIFVNNTLVKNYPSTDDLFQRTVRVFGKDVAKQTIKINHSGDGLSVTGYCVNPSVTRSNASKIFLFVNHRLIYDRGLISALFHGFQGRLMKGRFPLAAVFVDIDFDQVDVNVHPSKREIRFFNRQQVYEKVSRAISNAMMSAQKDMQTYSTPGSLNPALTRPEPTAWAEKEAVKENRVEQSVIHWAPPADSQRKGNPCPETETINQKGSEPIDHNKRSEPIHSFDTARLIGQVMGTYVLVETPQGLRLVDQHAAHERIVYEQLKNRYQSMEKISQQLIVPETIEVNHKEADMLHQLMDDFALIGIIIEPFGGTTFVIKAIPAIMDKTAFAPLILEIVEKALEEKNTLSSEDWLDKSLVTMACHSAVRANKTLTPREMEQLLVDLEHCGNPMHCPHGRPTMVTLSQGELEKLFKRVV